MKFFNIFSCCYKSGLILLTMNSIRHFSMNIQAFTERNDKLISQYGLFATTLDVSDSFVESADSSKIVPSNIRCNYAPFLQLLRFC